MKKLFALLISVMLLASLAVSASAGLFDFEAPSYEAVYGSAVIDGIVSEGEWDKAVEVELSTVGNPGFELPEVPTMKIMHDGTYMYVLIKTFTISPADNNAFVCVHVPHDGCTLDGCESHIKFALDGGVIMAATPQTDYQPWTYQKDENFDGECDYCAEKGGETQGATSTLGVATYNAISEYLYVECKVAANYGNPLPEGEAYVDIRIDDDTMHSSYKWANQPYNWAPGFDPATDAGTVTFLAEGVEPTVTEPVETEPAETEPAETEPTENEPKETEKADEPKDTEKTDAPTTDDAEEPAASSFPIVPIVIAAVALIAIVVVVIVLAKKKKK